MCLISVRMIPGGDVESSSFGSQPLAVSLLDRNDHFARCVCYRDVDRKGTVVAHRNILPDDFAIKKDRGWFSRTRSRNEVRADYSNRFPGFQFGCSCPARIGKKDQGGS